MITLSCKKRIDLHLKPQIENFSLSELIEWNRWFQKTVPNTPELLFAKAEKRFVENTFCIRVPINGSTGMVYFVKGTSLEAVFIRQLTKSSTIKDIPFTGDYELFDLNKFTYKLVSFTQNRVASSKLKKIAGIASSGNSSFRSNSSWFGQLLYCLSNYIISVPKKDANGEWNDCWVLGLEESVQEVQPPIGGGGGIDWQAFLATLVFPTDGSDPLPALPTLGGVGGGGAWMSVTPPAGGTPGQYTGSPGSNYDQVQDIIFDNLEPDEPVDDFDIDNTNDQSPTQVMPSNFTLSNGAIVSLKFGVTKDGQNAQKAVSIRLIAALKTALEITNQTVTITSIYIMATTNGEHTTPQSNHFRGLAVDISRINDIPIIVLGANNLVTALQQAIEQTTNRRENFGPALKLKLGQPWSIGGHDNHIHFSINGL